MLTIPQVSWRWVAVENMNKTESGNLLIHSDLH